MPVLYVTHKIPTINLTSERNQFKNDFIQATKDGLTKLRTLPGHVKSFASIDIEDEYILHMFSHWESQEDIGKLMRHPVFKEIQNSTSHMIDGPPQHHMFEPVKRQHP